MAPVALGVQITEISTLLQAAFDTRQPARDLAGDEFAVYSGSSSSGLFTMTLLEALITRTPHHRIRFRGEGVSRWKFADSSRAKSLVGVNREILAHKENPAVLIQFSGDRHLPDRQDEFPNIQPVRAPSAFSRTNSLTEKTS